MSSRKQLGLKKMKRRKKNNFQNNLPHFWNNFTNSTACIESHEVAPLFIYYTPPWLIKLLFKSEDPIWILARHGGERVPGLSAVQAPWAQIQTLNPCGQPKALSLIFTVSTGEVFYTLAALTRCSPAYVKAGFGRLESSASAASLLTEALYGVWTGSSKTMGWCRGWFTAVGEMWDWLWPTSQRTVCFSRPGRGVATSTRASAY